MKKKVLMLASVASMIDQFNMPNLRLLQELGYEVQVACNFLEGNTCDKKRIRKLQQKLSEMGVTWHQWNCPRNIRSLRKSAEAYRELICLLREQQYAWLHCHSPIGGALARLAAHRMGTPVIYTAHGFHFFKGAPVKNWLLYYPIEKYLARWTDILITINQEDYQLALKKLKAANIYYIPGVGIAASNFKSQSEDGCRKAKFRKKFHIPQDAVLLLSVGELSKRKNHQMVINALARLSEKNVYYLIGGQGALQKTLRKQARKLGISHHIRMSGFQENVKELYQNADIFVFPSKQEGLPVALLEAMAAGLPCLVSDIRGNRELIPAREERFSLKNREELYQKLTYMIQDEPGRKKKGAENQRQVQGFCLEIVDARMRRIYQDMEECICRRFP